jgi:Na+/melibiose symporter-like transporter
MVNQREKAKAEFRRMMLVIVVIAVLMVAAALLWLSSQGALTVHMVIASILGVFFSVVLGTGLFALAFFSDKSGHDATVTNASRRHNASTRSAADVAADTASADSNK